MSSTPAGASALGSANAPTRLFAGVLLSAALAAAAMSVSQAKWMQSHGFSALTLAIVFGMLVGNFMPGAWHGSVGAGINFSKQRLLRLGIILYGFRLTLQDVGHVGLAGVLIDAAVLVSTFLLACYAGARWFGLDPKTSMLIGVGSSVCGAAAVIGAEAVVKARAEQVAVAIATVVVFGTIAIFMYPLLYTLNADLHLIPGGMLGFGIYTGSTVHEVAQVVAIGKTIGAEAADTAVISKMVRVMMLAPFLMCIAAWLARQQRQGAATAGRQKLASIIPWFAVGFVLVVLFNSFGMVPTSASKAIETFDTIVLAMAMAALGVSTRVSALRQAGLKPLLLALVLFIWLVIGGGLINRLVMTSLA
ncbi:YeiH family protein [Pseudorhodoferax soli]|uniref:Putative integral membrane protein (TIGR00698 family) n=1 Tax=Pseudorhodoferax soli TaxID=545864 RepID=A0A368XN38_9BURK|nr:YeiH family protein [Pseudorhodoferax soli]RCW68586.1 putative integral membrane protein (TIGR00698 family) [Pseudorhodoferax soli]